MHRQIMMIIRGLAMLLGLCAAQNALACTVNTTPAISLGERSSFSMATTAFTVSSSSGITCPVLLQLGAENKMALRISSPTLRLNGPNNAEIPFTISFTNGGAPQPTGSIITLNTQTILSLLGSASSTVNFFIGVPASANLRAGTYTADVDVIWYYSVCTLGGRVLGIEVCLSRPESPDFGTGAGGWGTGVASKITITLVVARDCIINAPNVVFGSRPLPSNFDVISQSITVRCSVGTAYHVAMDDGKQPLNTRRRMSTGVTYLYYDILKGTTGTDRWGSNATERRSSATAEEGAGQYDGSATQRFYYRAIIDPAQDPPVVGTYLDTLRLNIIF